MINFADMLIKGKFGEEGKDRYRVYDPEHLMIDA